MLYVPCRQKPHYGDAGIIPGHPLMPKFALLLNESGGNTVYGLLDKKSYAFDSTSIPDWSDNGVRFNANRKHINGPPMNSIWPANSNGAIIFGYKRLSGTPASYYYFVTLDGSPTTFTFQIDFSSNVISLYINGSAIALSDAYTNYINSMVIAVTWNIVGANIYINFYSDGILRGQNSGNPVFPNSSSILNIGGRADSDGRYANGIYDYFYCYDRALSDYEILLLSKQPYSFLYSKTEQLIRPVWSIDGGGTTSVSIESESDIDLSIIRNRIISSAIESESDVSTNIIRKRFPDVNIDSESDLSMSIVRRRYLSVALNSESDNEADVFRRRYIDCLIESVSDIFITLATDTVSVVIESASDVIINAYRKRYTALDVLSESDIDILIRKIAYVALEITSESDIEISLEQAINFANAILFTCVQKGDIMQDVEQKGDIVNTMTEKGDVINTVIRGGVS